MDKRECVCVLKTVSKKVAGMETSFRCLYKFYPEMTQKTDHFPISYCKHNCPTSIKILNHLFTPILHKYSDLEQIQL